MRAGALCSWCTELTGARSLVRSFSRAPSRFAFSLIWPSCADQNRQRQWLRRCALQSSRVAGRTCVSSTATGAAAAALRHRWTTSIFFCPLQYQNQKAAPSRSRRPRFARRPAGRSFLCTLEQRAAPPKATNATLPGQFSVVLFRFASIGPQPFLRCQPENSEWLGV